MHLQHCFLFRYLRGKHKDSVELAEKFGAGMGAGKLAREAAALKFEAIKHAEEKKLI